MAALPRVFACIEGKLYEWGLKIALTDIPHPALSRPLDSIKSGNGQRRMSKQEELVIRKYSRELDNRIIEDALSSMNQKQREIVKYRYEQDIAWDDIAENLGIGVRHVYRLRDEILVILAYEFGYLGYMADRKETNAIRSRELKNASVYAK
jgi:hypothetical protein